MFIDKYGFFGFQAGDEIPASRYEIALDNLIRIAESIESMDLDAAYFETWNDPDYNAAYDNWIAFWGVLLEYVKENMSFTVSFDSPIKLDGIDEESSLISLFSKVFGIDTSSAPNNAERVFFPSDSDFEQLRGALVEFNFEISKIRDESPVPDFEAAPQVDEVEFSGFIKGEPKAAWTIQNLMSAKENRRLVYPSWQRKSDAWTPAKKQNLIRSLLLRIPLPSIIIHERNDGTKEVVDGRQRISALEEFFSNQFKTAKFDGNAVLNKTGALPTEAAGIEYFGNKFWSDMQGSIIRVDENRSKPIEDWMKDQIVPSLEFSGLTDEQLYYIFTVYNTNSTPLNAAEIRNAVYHDTPLHRALMKEAGDLEDEGGNEIQPTRPEISNRFRAGVSPSKPPTRFAASEALMRACAFTLIRSKADGSHKADSAAKAIQSMLIMTKDDEWSEEDASELAVRIINSYQTMRDAFDRVGLDPINRPSGERQTMRYNTVRATSMHSAFTILDHCRYDNLKLKDTDFDDFVRLIDSIEQDDKQSNTKTWNFHLGVIYKTIQFLESKGYSRDKLLSTPYRDVLRAAIISKE